MTFRHVSQGTVVSTFQAEVAGLPAAPEDGKAVVIERRKGDWYVRLEGCSAIRVGPEEPKLKPGDVLRMTLEKVEPELTTARTRD